MTGRDAPITVSPFYNCKTSSLHVAFCWIMLRYGGMSITQLSSVKVYQCSVLTLSLGLPPEPWGDPAALDCTRTNSSLVTVATDSVELLTFPSEELSSMAGWSRLGRPGFNLSPSLFFQPSSVGGQPAFTKKSILSIILKTKFFFYLSRWGGGQSYLWKLFNYSYKIISVIESAFYTQSRRIYLGQIKLIKQVILGHS